MRFLRQFASAFVILDLAGSASALPGAMVSLRVKEQILPGVWMPLRTMCFACVPSGESRSRENIEPMCSYPKMLGIYALVIPAHVVNSEPIWDGSEKDHIGNTMGNLRSPSSRTRGNGHLTVPCFGVAGKNPVPAFGYVVDDETLKESLDPWYVGRHVSKL